MKGFRLFFTACLTTLVFCGVRADDAGDVARAAVRRGTSSSSTTASNTATSSSTNTRQKPAATSTAPATQSAATTSRTTVSTASRDRGTSTARDGAGLSARDTASTVATRAAGSVQSRTTAAPQGVSARQAVSARDTATTTRATQSRATTTGRSAIPVRTISTGRTTTATNGAQSRVARTATTNATRLARAGTLTREEILNRNYSACKDVYYECMDEFCANKDSQLKRCACSSRISEFDRTKRQLDKVEDKMLDFSQRLLTVNMDKEDAAALSVATEGELAFNQKDTSASKKLLDQIAKKLNTSFDSSNFDTGPNALSWSLNIDAAFDSVDSMMGAATTSKTGTALYGAALPICREMAKEVCSDEELTIAENGYMVAIEQDCNTVAKTYETQVEQAREKVREGGALLDISRLDIYQKRNSDDILACKKKMLDKLYDTTVCGDGLGKCLDTSGRYIDPSTGAAFLTVNLVELGGLISRPTGDETWSSAPGNQVFVSYLNSKKKYLTPAMENCQDIADIVWTGFIEDALAQIKLAQESKLEDMRQSCTKLTTQCLTETSQSLADFDARALSIFGVAADKTVNAMCAEVKNACTALLESSGGGTDWVGGITEIATDMTYETILQTCREVGRACIIQACRSISGNFGLCEAMDTSNNRKAIINRTSCWDEVENCVRSAGGNQVDAIMAQLRKDSYGIVDKDTGTFYANVYGTGYEITNEEALIDTGTKVENEETRSIVVASDACYYKSLDDNPNCIYDLCSDECDCDINETTAKYECAAAYTTECNICRLTERIWGNCETTPQTQLAQANDNLTDGKKYHNRIRAPKDETTSTLLYWMAVNTGTEELYDSCRSTMCGIGFYQSGNTCVPVDTLTNDCNVGVRQSCPTDEQHRITVGSEYVNCCPSGIKLDTNICCAGRLVDFDGVKMCLPNEIYKVSVPININKANYIPGGTFHLACIGASRVDETSDALECEGRFVMISGNGKEYYTPPYEANPNITNVDMYADFGDSIKGCSATGNTTNHYTCSSSGCSWGNNVVGYTVSYSNLD